jgi:hypothetical protein
MLVYPTGGRLSGYADRAPQRFPPARKEPVPLKIDRLVVLAAGASLALVAPLAAQAPKASPKPAAAPGKPAAAKPAAPKVAADPVQEAKVKARVTEYWKERMKLNLATILPYYESSFRSALTPEKFTVDFRRLNRFNPEFLGVDGVTFDSPTRATVKVKLKTKAAVLENAELVTSTDEYWVLENGQWYHAAEAMIPSL